MSTQFGIIFNYTNGNLSVNTNIYSYNSFITSSIDENCITIYPDIDCCTDLKITSVGYCTTGSDIGKYIINKSSHAIYVTDGKIGLNSFSSTIVPTIIDPLYLPGGHTVNIVDNTVVVNMLADPNVDNTIRYNIDIKFN